MAGRTSSLRDELITTLLRQFTEIAKAVALHLVPFALTSARAYLRQSADSFDYADAEKSCVPHPQ
jgi:hypothetical protein